MATVLLAIRPEDIEVSAHAPQRDNVLPCVIETKIFSGTAPTIFVKAGRGSMLAVRGADRATFEFDAAGHAGLRRLAGEPGLDRQRGRR